jgi:uncharacterized protein Yka (UPF0111/DUF47 family)
MMLFAPNDKEFHKFFEQAAANNHEAAVALADFLSKFDTLPERARKIKELEHVGDRLTHELMERLNKTFITSIDREDIQNLASRLDDIVDMIDESAIRIVLYRIDRPEEDAKVMAEHLTRATALIVGTMPLLRNMSNSKSILAKCREIAAVEKEADRASERALAGLFESSKDPTHVIKWKDIYEDMETACNHCKHVANVIEEIVLKNQ